MVQLKIAFLDEEEAYLEQLKAYLVRKKEMFFKIWTFSSAESFFKQEKKKEKFDAVVMTDFFWEKLEGHALGAKKILLCEGDRKEGLSDCLFVPKHQSAEKMLGQISAMLWQEEDGDKRKLPQNMAELIGVYSPINYESQMVFSMTMAQIFGESKKTLYVSLMGHSGFYRLTNTEAEEDIGDLLYGMMQPDHDFAAGLHKVCRRYRNFDYIPPAVNPEHLPEISKSLLEQLLMALKNRSGYDVAIVDFGMVFPGFAELLPVFASFYCLGREGMLSRLRMEEFLEYLGKEGEHAAAHMNRLLLQDRMLPFEDRNLLESSLYGGMGDYIRRCLYGGVEIGR